MPFWRGGARRRQSAISNIHALYQDVAIDRVTPGHLSVPGRVDVV
jgi:hypothetical protein